MGCTPRGIYYDLSNSPYIKNISPENNFQFVFSSQFNLDRFNSQSKDFLNIEIPTLAYKLGFAVNEVYASKILLMKLYCKIEKRGFLIKHNGEAIKSPDEIILKLIIS